LVDSKLRVKFIALRQKIKIGKKKLSLFRFPTQLRFNSSPSLQLFQGKTMKSNIKDENSLLFKWACKVLKYFLLTILGFAVACILSQVFSISAILELLLSPNVWQWFARAGVFIFCLFAIAIIFESSR
jgi:hypothetical protein